MAQRALNYFFRHLKFVILLFFTFLDILFSKAGI
jgi:hypothetical protein